MNILLWEINFSSSLTFYKLICTFCLIADYVYNPKEARLRKAMREANRERALGVAMQQHSPRGGRRSQQPWSMNEEEQQQLMMVSKAHSHPIYPSLSISSCHLCPSFFCSLIRSPSDFGSGILFFVATFFPRLNAHSTLFPYRLSLGN